MFSEWFIKLASDREEGPFTIRDLKNNPKITPDTLVRKKGWKQWKKMRDVPELKKVFKDEEGDEEEEEKKKKAKDTLKEGPERTLAMQQDPPHLIFWLLLAFLVIYLFYLFQRH